MAFLPSQQSSVHWHALVCKSGVCTEANGSIMQCLFKLSRCPWACFSKNMYYPDAICFQSVAAKQCRWQASLMQMLPQADKG